MSLRGYIFITENEVCKFNPLGEFMEKLFIEELNPSGINIIIISVFIPATRLVAGEHFFGNKVAMIFIYILRRGTIHLVFANIRKTQTKMKFLFTSIFLLSLSSSAFSVKWIEAQNGEIPENAVKFKHSYTEYTNTVYCRAKDEESDNLHSGIMHEGEEACEYPIVSSNSVAYASEYEILSLDDSKDRIQFRFRLPGEPVPPGAVKCHDDEIEDCYFGRSMYSDGICEEELGKIDPSSELGLRTKEWTSHLST
ncbi:unnamed protein product [Lepeophtheirus salmonis]|uniref:(salmon louse) hypothetical protein n=1 Tax=Lepeophtheirus salmonis TaxID=72036 RepID=A0A7R8CRC3_LEPSM|nr:unnamed protein product [Lepeophtheirus salmonis]CAF2904113.1 unnamed protein product [Lepeophtheirus salmonis]